MQMDGLWTVHALLALSGLVLGNPLMIHDPLAAPRVFISFKGRNLNLILGSFIPTCLFQPCAGSLINSVWFARRVTDDSAVRLTGALVALLSAEGFFPRFFCRG